MRLIRAAPAWLSECGPVDVSIPSLTIQAVLPNSRGLDEQDDAVRLRNTRTSTAALDGWILGDRAGRTWSLSGQVVPASGTLVGTRAGQPVALNNNGPELVDLVNSSAAVVDSFSYDAAEERVWAFP